MTSRRPTLLRVVIAPLEAFFRLEAASGLALAFSAAVSLAWANSPWHHGLEALIHLDVAAALPGWHIPLEHVVNDGLMTLFFFLVGLEIKRELSVGELASVPKAMLPALAAAGGMIAPALLYLLFTRGTPQARGWGIPMATDIAFSLGCVTLIPGRVARAMVVFLTALAIFDDLGGILVIALFYGSGIHLGWLLAAIAVTVAVAMWHQFGRPHAVLDAAALVALWLLLHHAGIHPSLAGVALGMAIPATDRGDGSRIDHYEHALHGWVAYLIIPLFALLNAGVYLRHLGLADALHPVSLGVGVGLVVGKQIGIFGTTALAVVMGLAPMPGNASFRELWAVSAIAGIGFTVALFVGSLAFGNDAVMLDRAKLGILVGSLTAAVFGLAIVRFAVPRKAP